MSCAHTQTASYVWDIEILDIDRAFCGRYPCVAARTVYRAADGYFVTMRGLEDVK